MGKASLTAEVAFLDILLGIVPSTTGIGHEHSQREAASQTANEQTENTSHTENDTYHDGDEDSEHRGNDHLMLGSTGGDFHTTTVVRCACAFQNTCNLAELTTNLLHHLLGSTAYSLHRHTAEQEGSHCTLHR